MSVAFPFSAIVGQDEMKRALRLSAIEPRLGGILVIGDRGTGKTTAVRGLSRLLPSIETRAGCAYNCEPAAPAPSCRVCNAGRPPKKVALPAPVVDLPLGATEDRVLGSLDLERALVSGEKVFEPGLLARAHRGYLYVDEVNLLEDHLVDLLLDVAASGECVIEREGLSVRHPARFVLVGSGNPEEGELRPQLLDRFGLSVEVASPDTVAERVEVMRRRDAFENDPVGFTKRYAKADAAERKAVLAARAALATIALPDAVLEFISGLCLSLGVDGLRGELTLLRAARASAALDGADTVSIDDVAKMAPSALRHRLRRDPLDELGSGTRVRRAVDKLLSDGSGDTASKTTLSDAAPMAEPTYVAASAARTPRPERIPATVD